MHAAKQAAKALVLHVWLLFFRVYRLFCRKGDIVIACPPFPSNSNIGDRAMCVGALDALRAVTDAPICMVQASSEDMPPFDGYSGVSVERRLYLNFIHDHAWAEQLRWIALLRHAKRVYMIGADSVDETYASSQSRAKLMAVSLSGRLGIPTRLVSFSVNQATPDFARRVSALPARVSLFPRDPVSFERLRAVHARNLHVAGDLSFLVRPAESISDPACRDYIASDGRDLVGINLIASRAFPNDVDFTGRLNYFADALYEFAKSANVRFLFVPNTSRQKKAYFEALQAALEARAPRLTYLVDPLPSCEELKRVLSHCAYLFSGSYHLALFALSVGVPVTCFPYVGKFEGVLSEFEIADSTISLEDLPRTPSDLAELLGMHYGRRQSRRESVERNLPRMVRSAAANLAEV
jgi:polysaccharide pyruvyl transferase WcaK-like protein